MGMFCNHFYRWEMGNLGDWQSTVGWRLLVAATAFSACSGAIAASFDCGKARTSVEKSICANSSLSQLDDSMASMYKDAVARGGETVRNDQRIWFREREKCRDENCILIQYQERIATLGKFIFEYDRQQSPLTKKSDPISGTSDEKPLNDSKAVAWLERNQWFKESKVMREYALSLHERLVQQGADPKSDEYYVKIDRGMREKFPSYFSSESPTQPQAATLNTNDLFRDAVARVDRDDPKGAVAIMRPFAIKGDSRAQTLIGLLYVDSSMLDYVEAANWFQLAATQGDVTAQYQLGVLYYMGKGVPKDYVTSAKWFRLVAEQRENKEQAKAEQFLGLLYKYGLGVVQDYAQAVGWFRRAAAQGNVHAQFNLGLLYSEGKGVPRNDVRAYMWINLSAASGDADYVKERDQIAKRMALHQITEAQSLARNCKAENYQQCGEIIYVTTAPAISQSPSQLKEESPASRVSQGTGFFVSKDGYLITNEHVVESCQKIDAITVSGQRIPLRAIRVSKTDDLALLKSTGSVNLGATAAFRESAKISQGEAIVAYGFPLGGLLASAGNVTTGNVTALAGLRDDGRHVQISAPIQPGNSGGPLVDVNGLLVGVIVSKLDAIKVANVTSDIPQNVNFAIKASAVINIMDASSVKYEVKKPWQTMLQRGQSVETATNELKKYTVKVECIN